MSARAQKSGAGSDSFAVAEPGARERVLGDPARLTARTRLRNFCTWSRKPSDCWESSPAAESTFFADVPLSSATCWTPWMFDETSWVPRDASWALRAISWVAAPCSSTAGDGGGELVDFGDHLGERDIQLRDLGQLLADVVDLIDREAGDPYEQGNAHCHDAEELRADREAGQARTNVHRARP